MENINRLAKYLQATILEKILNNISENVKLEKKEISGTIIYKSPEVECEKYNISRCLYFDKYNEIVIKFSKKLEDSFPHCNLSSFYTNMLTAEIKDKIEDSETLKRKIKENVAAFYHPTENYLQLFTFESYIHSLFHELLHLSSRRKIGKIALVGFAQLTSNKKTVGVYLNEGYTEYLNQKYISKKELRHYNEARIFAQGIEKIVGSKKMEELYFDADLLGLINELGKYYPKEEVVKLINKIDFYYKQFHNDSDETNKTYEEINKTYEEILTTIANIHRIKLSKDLAAGKIDEAEYRKRKLLYCDDYEDSRVNSDNVTIQEYEEYFLIADNETNESHYYMKPPEDIVDEAQKEKKIDISKTNSLEELLQMVSPEKQMAIDELKKKQETENLKK